MNLNDIYAQVVLQESNMQVIKVKKKNKCVPPGYNGIMEWSFVRKKKKKKDKLLKYIQDFVS